MRKVCRAGGEAVVDPRGEDHQVSLLQGTTDPAVVLVADLPQVRMSCYQRADERSGGGRGSEKAQWVLERGLHQSSLLHLGHSEFLRRRGGALRRTF
jgi:hypothetical protein